MSTPNFPHIIHHIEIENLSARHIQVQDPEKTLLRHFQDAGLDWMHACGGKGRCTTCKVIIVRGLENTNALTLPEQRYRDLKALREDERLACQARTTGSLTVRVPKECKLPHIKYSDD